MPELPDILLYLEALDKRLPGRRLDRIRISSPFLLRSVDPPVEEAEGRRVAGLRRIGKRVVIGLENDVFLILHLMIAGRLHWGEAGSNAKFRNGQAAFDFEHGTLVLTEAGSKKRASLHLARGEAGLRPHDPGGLEVLESSPAQFRDALSRESHTLKRALTDPRLFSGIGNAWSDEILHRAKLSPFQNTRSISEEESGRIHRATIDVMTEALERLRRETGDSFPEGVTAFRDWMAVHGRFKKPCPVCGAPVQRVVYAENEMNYCPGCQTGGKILADRSLSRLLKDDWPRTLEELEERRR